MDSFNESLAGFEAATNREMRRLLNEGKSYRVAIRELNTRMFEAEHLDDAATAASMSRTSGHSSEDLLYALVPARVMERLRTNVEAAEAVSILTKRIELPSPRPSSPRHSTSPLSSASVASVPSTPGIATMPAAPKESAPSAAGLPESRVRLSPQIATSSNGVNTERVSLKRSRGNNDGGGGGSGPPEPGKDQELSRQLSIITLEINDAMRAGDRSKVGALMRRRDQMRSTKQPTISSSMAPSSPSCGGSDGKRGRLMRS